MEPQFSIWTFIFFLLSIVYLVKKLKGPTENSGSNKIRNRMNKWLKISLFVFAVRVGISIILDAIPGIILTQRILLVVAILGMVAAAIYYNSKDLLDKYDILGFIGVFIHTLGFAILLLLLYRPIQKIFGGD